MRAVRVATTVEADGELHLTDLPCRRGDKFAATDRQIDQLGYELSFVVRPREGITEALTGDHHFQQAGFVALLK